jgi:hypothetical protein
MARASTCSPPTFWTKVWIGITLANTRNGSADTKDGNEEATRAGLSNSNNKSFRMETPPDFKIIGAGVRWPAKRLRAAVDEIT